MILKSILLQNFRSYLQEKIDFHSLTTVIVGQNTAGKTNLAEAIMLLSTGKSFRAEKDFQMISFDQEVGRVQGLVTEGDEKTKLEVMLAQGSAAGGRFIKRYLVNEVPRSRNGFVGSLPAVLFRPEELDIIIDGPSLRRGFLDEVLEQIDQHYRTAKITYDKALRQRNALLDLVRETGQRDSKQFAYWNSLLIENGATLTKYRENFITFINTTEKEIFDCSLVYDKSIMSEERLLQYQDAEVRAGNTLVGPQRDDFSVQMKDEKGRDQNIEYFGSRGQQRLAILQLKLLHIAYVEQSLQQKPLLVLDDIFSELDSRHIDLVLEKVKGRQIVLTTTHKEFLQSHKMTDISMVELKK